MGDIYNDTNELSSHATQIVAEQRGSVPDNYPSDYLYYPLNGNDGKPLITKVGDENYSAWMKRSEEGAAFTDIVLLTENQVNNIYAERPSAKPDSEGGNAKSFRSTGVPVYVNPDLDEKDENYKFLAKDYSKVSYYIENGKIVDGVYAFDADINRQAAQRNMGKEIPAEYRTALLPKSLTKDGNVSESDLEHELKGYQLSTEIVTTHSQDSANKAVAEKFLFEEIAQSNSYLNAANSGAHAPDIVIINGSVVSNIDNMMFETGLQGKQNVSYSSSIDINSMVEADFAAAIAAAAAAAKTTPKIEGGFNKKAASMPVVKASALDAHMDKLDEKRDSGAADGQVNRVISNGILKYLDSINRDETLFAAEASKAIAGLRDRGLGEHADILAEYSNGDIDRRDARKALRKVEINPVAKFEPAPNPNAGEFGSIAASSEVSLEDGMAEIMGGLDNLKPMLSEARAAMAAMQEGITLDVINGALESQGIDPNSLTDIEKQYLRTKVKNAIGSAAKDAENDIETAMSPENVRSIVQNTMEGVPAMIESRTSEAEQRVQELVLESVRDKFEKAVASGVPKEQINVMCQTLVENPAYKGLDCSNIGSAAPAP